MSDDDHPEWDAFLNTLTPADVYTEQWRPLSPVEQVMFHNTIRRSK